MSLALRECLVDARLCPNLRYGGVADSAFPCAGNMTGRILTLSKGEIGVRCCNREKAVAFVRQAAERGMGSIEKVCHRLYFPLPTNKTGRETRLNNLFCLSNYRVRTVGISQIRAAHKYDRRHNPKVP
ncbi:hypothetical protein GQ600_8607 [Phytophthora cactorum]|nr:hypothetical protein GQ600_8607 [Phytophthora cactorum]